MNKKNVFKVIGAFVFLTFVAVGYQNCGANSGSFNFNGGAESASSGTIVNTVQQISPIAAAGCTSSGAGCTTSGGGHTCAINSSGVVKCWGDNASGELGNGVVGSNSPTAGPLNPALPAIAVKIIASVSNTCALLINGLVYCWGDNTYGQIGNGQIGAPVINPTPVSALPGPIYDIALTAGTLCAVTRTGVIGCVGTNGNGELGVGTAITSSLTAVYVSNITNAVAITGSVSHFCATTSTHAVWCWGGGANAVNLGNDTTTSSPSLPVQVVGVAGIPSDVNTGATDTCIVLSGGATQCFGDNTYGQLADGNQSQTAFITPVSGGQLFFKVAVGVGTVCGLNTSDQVYCWGAWGSTSLVTPTGPMKLGSSAIAASAIAGGGSHDCAIQTTGTATCWGQNASGQLGNNSTTASPTVAVQVVNFP